MSIKYLKTALVLTSICMIPLSSVAALAQETPFVTECRPHLPFVDGLWKDDGNGKEVKIKVTPYLNNNRLHGRIEAVYTQENKVCRNLDKDGKPVPFQTDFDGFYDSEADAARIGGSLYYCFQNKRDADSTDGKKPYTLYISRAILKLNESKDGKKLSGTFDGANGIETITFTRESDPEPPLDYQLTNPEVGRAILKVFRARGIKVTGALDAHMFELIAADEKGWNFGIPFVTDPATTGHNEAVILGSVEAMSPCKELTVNITVTTQGSDGKYKDANGTGGSGNGDFSKDGLDAAMNSAFDKSNIGKYLPKTPSH